MELKLILNLLREELRESTEKEEERFQILEEIERVKVKIAMRELGWDKC